MLKTTLVASLLAMASQCFAGQVSQFDNEIKLSSQSLASGFVNRGNENLRAGKYFPALNDFQNASPLLSNFQECKSNVSFLIFFGKVIACDNLGFHEQSQQAMISLLLLVENREDDSCVFTFDEINALVELATLAPSPNIQAILLYLCNTISSSIEN